MAFEPEEVAVDEAVSMDASDVGWGDTPTTTSTATGWATFDSFTDIRMAPSRFVFPSIQRVCDYVHYVTTESHLHVSCNGACYFTEVKCTKLASPLLTCIKFARKFMYDKHKVCIKTTQKASQPIKY